MPLPRTPRTSPSPSDTHASGNRLLAALLVERLSPLAKVSELVELPVKQQIYAYEEMVETLYFPVTALVSSVVRMKNGDGVEVGSVGREGMIGISALMGYKYSGCDFVVELGGSAWQMPATTLVKQVQSCKEAAHIVTRYAQVRLIQVGQTAACNLLHSVKQRFARRLLRAQDDLGTTSFPLTHEFVSELMGAQRSTVTFAACELERSGAIRYKHGNLSILDRQQLERSTCECYWILRRHLEAVVEHD